MKILRAWWYSPSEIAVVFNRDLKEIPLLEIIGNTSHSSFSVERPSKEFFSKISSYYIEDGKVHFVLSDVNFPNYSSSADIDYYVCGNFNGWGEAIGNEKWLMHRHQNGTRELVCDISKLNFNHGYVHFKFVTRDGHWLEPLADAPNLERDKHGYANLKVFKERTGNHIFIIKMSEFCGLCESLIVKAPQINSEVTVGVAELLLEINSRAKLGAYLCAKVTNFAIFAPRAKAAYLLWKRENDKTEKVITAQTEDGAVWKAVADEDLVGARYMWHIEGENKDATTDFDKYIKIADPYAIAMDSSNGECIVSYPEPYKGEPFTPPCWHDLIIMEAHLRDVLARAKADISPEERLTFKGLEKWLASSECYLRKSGVNCIELQPIQEFTAANKTDYEWGYMPVNWFAPSSSYAEFPHEPSQAKDLAALVKAFHNAGLAVVLDVVYNHVGEPNYLVHVDKEYYFETYPDGTLKNFSGCGNDFRADAPMSKRMIIESLKSLIINFDVDGFRFDLAELLGIKVLKEIERELKKIKPSVILIAEPWSFRGHIATSLRDTGYASWNDGFREFMLRYARGDGDFEGFKYYISGSPDGFASFPAQTVNYLESHDDMCLLDRITTSYFTPSVDDIRRYKIGYALILLSLGIPMVEEGFDLLRTKYGKNNTYKDGAANALDYMRGLRFPGLSLWMHNLVKFRKSPSGAALRCSHKVSPTYIKFFQADMSNAAAVVFNADKSRNVPIIFAVFNPTIEFVDFPVGETHEIKFKNIANIDSFDSNKDAYIYSHGILTIPPLSFSLFVERF